MIFIIILSLTLMYIYCIFMFHINQYHTYLYSQKVSPSLTICFTICFTNIIIFLSSYNMFHPPAISPQGTHSPGSKPFFRTQSPGSRRQWPGPEAWRKSRPGGCCFLGMEKQWKISQKMGKASRNHLENGKSHNLWPMFMGQIGKKHLEIVEICRNHL